jgi:hypothetical protein
MIDANIPDFSFVRTVVHSAKTWFCLTDLAVACGGEASTDDLMGDFFEVPAEYRSVRTLYSPSGVAEELPVLTREGVVRVLLASELPGFLVLRHALMLSALSSALRDNPLSPVRRATQWGEQPVRQLLRDRGSSMAQLASMLSAVPGRPEQVFKVSTLNAVLFGRQLPSPEFLSRARYVFQRQPQELFTAEVLEASARKHGLPTPSHPSPATPPIAQYDVSPVVVVEAGPVDLSGREPAWRQVADVVEPSFELPELLSDDDLMDAAFTEAFGTTGLEVPFGSEPPAPDA